MLTRPRQESYSRVMSGTQVADSATDDQQLTRSLSATLAPLVAELELDQPEVVTVADLESLRERHGIRTETKHLAARLRQRGWLLATSTPGVWEFAPGAHGGPLGHANPFLELTAALRVRPIPGAAVALGSALLALNLSDRGPARLEIAVAKGASVPAGLRRAARVVVFDSRIAPVRRDGAPVHSPVSILVHLVTRPTDVRSWGSVLDALPALLDAIDREALDTEMARRPASVGSRLAYLVHALDPALAEKYRDTSHGKVWFGPRGPLKRNNEHFAVADTVLPFDPASLQQDT